MFCTTNINLGFVRCTISASFLNAISLPAPGVLPTITVTGFVGSHASAGAAAIAANMIAAIKRFIIISFVRLMIYS